LDRKCWGAVTGGDEPLRQTTAANCAGGDDDDGCDDDGCDDDGDKKDDGRKGIQPTAMSVQIKNKNKENKKEKKKRKLFIRVGSGSHAAFGFPDHRQAPSEPTQQVVHGDHQYSRKFFEFITDLHMDTLKISVHKMGRNN